jgi:hypothetical protein
MRELEDFRIEDIISFLESYGYEVREIGPGNSDIEYTGVSDQMTDAEYWAEMGNPSEEDSGTTMEDRQ